MDINEFSIIAQTLKKAYNRHHFLEDQEEATVWFEMLKDLDANTVAKAVRYFIQNDTLGYPPVIGQIRAAALDSTGERVEDWEAGWAKVMKAISAYGRYQMAEALESFDEITRRTVEAYGWDDLCNADIGDTTVKAQFRDIYRNRANQENTLRQVDKRFRIGIEKAIAIESK